MTNTAVPAPPSHNSTARRRPDDLWALGERAIVRARRWVDESAHEPTPPTPTTHTCAREKRASASSP